MLTSMPPEVQRVLSDMVPFPSRLEKPDGFAKLALHIVENSYINSEVIRLDGAIRMTAKQPSQSIPSISERQYDSLREAYVRQHYP